MEYFEWYLVILYKKILFLGGVKSDVRKKQSPTKIYH